MDFTGDGIADILSGCYWSQDENKPDGNPQAGYFMILKGKDRFDFEEAKPITDRDGQPLLNVPLTKKQEENYDTNNIEWSNICTAQHAVDYDGDGDLDLVTGCMRNSFFVITNSSKSSSEPPNFDSPAEKLAISSPDQHSDPHLYDWDGDGDLDLLTGGDSGSVYLSVNKGTRQEPEWSDFERLVPGNIKYFQSTDDGQEIAPGRASRVWVTDFNRDGKPDLLVGDSVTIHNKVGGLTESEFATKKAAHELKANKTHSKINEVRDKYIDKLTKATERNNDEEVKKISEKMQSEMEPYYAEYTQLHEEQNEFLEEISTGHVWVYLQR